ncbi:biotin--[acetyl-CoA-carboxylase] ligase [Facklamia lactis]|uniref:biotin--[acetyl-CoA-carboxylase] ligase n=1 Tax=Facklamia lactis TaxID=2749967 RepID=UPI0018CD1095|nr:biotin--[acetyl-CoA-carboxylase] ligase [Facklamia lactis]MBG9980790.1 biotin--[acetyl-CoA-carboxylase] ligase [Facklamia lactis]
MHIKIKDQVLLYLISHQNQIINGANLASELKVSRNAVWKAIKQLIQEGHAIESSQSKGYQLKSLSQTINPLLIQHEVRKPWKNLHIHYENGVTSTNDLAKEWLITHPGQKGLFISNHQTQGRGRHGKAFYSKLDEGLYFSIVLPIPALLQAEFTQVTLITAVALIDILQDDLSEELKIKWVNDIFYQQRKVAGILSEANVDIESQTISNVIIGIGLNLAGDITEMDQETQQIAGTLFGHKIPKNFSKNSLIANVINQIQHYLDELPQNNYLSIYRQHLLGLNQKIFYSSNQKEEMGIMKGINDQGQLIVQQNNQNIVHLNSGNIRIGSQQFVSKKETKHKSNIN